MRIRQSSSSLYSIIAALLATTSLHAIHSHAQPSAQQRPAKATVSITAEHDRMRESLLKAEPFHGRVITRCALVGAITVGKSELAVLDVQSVLKGMLAPRGFRDLMLVSRLTDGDFCRIEFNHPIRSDSLTEPLWCHADRIFLAGRTTHLPGLTAGRKHNGNCMQFAPTSNGFDFQMLDVAAYGSSGGIDSKVPTMEEREQERLNWDEK